MCKEDIRIGRKKAAQKAAGDDTAFTTGSVLLCRANPNRYALIVAEVLGLTGAAFNLVVSADGPGGALICNIYHNVRQYTLTVEEFGQLVTGEVWITGWATGAFRVRATELLAYEDLKDV